MKKVVKEESEHNTCQSYSADGFAVDKPVDAVLLCEKNTISSSESKEEFQNSMHPSLSLSDRKLKK